MANTMSHVRERVRYNGEVAVNGTRWLGKIYPENMLHPFSPDIASGLVIPSACAKDKKKMVMSLWLEGWMYALARENSHTGFLQHGTEDPGVLSENEYL